MEILNRSLHMLCAIVNFGMGSRTLKEARLHGARGGTVLLGSGTAHSRLLELLDLCDVRKEIVLILCEEATARTVEAAWNKLFAFHKPHHGIAYSKPIACFMGSGHYAFNERTESEAETHMPYRSITLIADKGRAELAMEAANQAGAKGGTIINARGAGIHETQHLFAMDIEPEKEILIILAEADATEPIVTAIREKLELEQPGNGVMYVERVESVHGMHR